MGVPLSVNADFMALLERVVGGTGLEEFTDTTLSGDQFNPVLGAPAPRRDAMRGAEEPRKVPRVGDAHAARDLRDRQIGGAQQCAGVGHAAFVIHACTVRPVRRRNDGGEVARGQPEFTRDVLSDSGSAMRRSITAKTFGDQRFATAAQVADHVVVMRARSISNRVRCASTASRWPPCGREFGFHRLDGVVPEGLPVWWHLELHSPPCGVQEREQQRMVRHVGHGSAHRR